MELIAIPRQVFKTNHITDVLHWLLFRVNKIINFNKNID